MSARFRIDPRWPAVLRWACRFLPEYFCDLPAPFHSELLRDLQSPERRLLARVAPRGHAKSTCASLAYPLWCVCEQRKWNIVLITFEASLARQFLRDIRGELETNEALRKRYGDLCSTPTETPARRHRTAQREAGRRPAGPLRPRRPWSADRFVTTTGVVVQARGCGSSLRGTRSGPRRPDLIICDDIESDKQVGSAERRRKLEHWLRRVVIPALAPGGQLVVLGSLLHFDSLLANLRDPQRFPRWDYRIYRALEAERGADGAYRHVPLWPARWPGAQLAEERQRIGELAFQQEYMANPVDDERRLFRPEWLHRYDPAQLAARAEHLVNFIAVDPASGAAGGDYVAIWVGSLDLHSEKIYTRELILERINFVEQIERVLQAFRRWRPVKIGIEVTGNQSALLCALQDRGRREHLYLPLTPIHALRDKWERIRKSTVEYESGRFHLPPGLPPEVEAQFLLYPRGDHDDAPDVCAMGIELARAFGTGRVEGLTRPRRFPGGRADW